MSLPSPVAPVLPPTSNDRVFVHRRDLTPGEAEIASLWRDLGSARPKARPVEVELARGRWTEEEFASRLLAREDKAWQEFLRLHNTAALGALRALGIRRRECPDVIQEASFHFYRKLGDFDPSRGSLRTCFLTCVKWAGGDERRRMCARKTEELDQNATCVADDDMSSNPTNSTALAAAHDALQEVRSKLSKRLLAVFDLILAGHSNVRIVTILGIDAGAVRVARHRLYSKLRQNARLREAWSLLIVQHGESRAGVALLGILDKRLRRKLIETYSDPALVCARLVMNLGVFSDVFSDSKRDEIAPGESLPDETIAIIVSNLLAKLAAESTDATVEQAPHQSIRRLTYQQRARHRVAPPAFRERGSFMRAGTRCKQTLTR